MTNPQSRFCDIAGALAKTDVTQPLLWLLEILLAGVLVPLLCCFCGATLSALGPGSPYPYTEPRYIRIVIAVFCFIPLAATIAALVMTSRFLIRRTASGSAIMLPSPVQLASFPVTG